MLIESDDWLFGCKAGALSLIKNGVNRSYQVCMNNALFELRTRLLSIKETTANLYRTLMLYLIALDPWGLARPGSLWASASFLESSRISANGSLCDLCPRASGSKLLCVVTLGQIIVSKLKDNLE